MGRRDKRYSKTLHQQAYEKLNSMQAFGQSKKDAMKDGTAKDKIFSYNTYKTDWKHTKYFISYMKENHPQVTTLGKAEKYVKEFLQFRVDQGHSAWSVQTEAKALGKLFGIEPGSPNYFECPKRERSEIKRSRDTAKRDRHFSKANNAELINFCKGTGLRRSELEKLKGKDMVNLSQIERRLSELEGKVSLTEKEEKTLAMLKDVKLYGGRYENFLFVKGKGGRLRLSPIIGEHSEDIVARIRRTGKDENVWLHVHGGADIHGYRGDYATSIYKAYARDIKDIPYDKKHQGTGRMYQGDVYTCRKDEAGKKLDKKAMLICSKALGHNRIEVVANNYIRGL